MYSGGVGFSRPPFATAAITLAGVVDDLGDGCRRDHLNGRRGSREARPSSVRGRPDLKSGMSIEQAVDGQNVACRCDLPMILDGAFAAA